MNQFNDRITKVKNRYRAAHAALSVLAPLGFWRLVLKPLRDSDIVSPDNYDVTNPVDEEGNAAPLKKAKTRKNAKTTASEGKTPLGQGKSKTSWLWMAEVAMTEKDIFANRPPQPDSSPFLPSSAKLTAESLSDKDDPHSGKQHVTYFFLSLSSPEC